MRNIPDETDDFWLLQASENKLKSRISSKKNLIFEQQASKIGTVQEDSANGRKETDAKPSIPVYIKPTTMRGIPLERLISSPVIRGFYIRKNESDLSIWTHNWISTNNPTEQPIEKTLTPDVSIDEFIIEDRNKESKLTVDPVNEQSRRGKALRGSVSQSTTTLPRVLSPTTPTRRAIAHAVSKYNDLTTPLWTGRRIVARKRNRATVSPIKNSIKQTEASVTRTKANTFDTITSTSNTTVQTTSSTTPAIQTIPLVRFEYTISSRIFDTYSVNISNTNDTENHSTAKVATTQTKSTAANTPAFSMFTSTISKPAVTIRSITTEDSSAATTSSGYLDTPTIRDASSSIVSTNTLTFATDAALASTAQTFTDANIMANDSATATTLKNISTKIETTATFANYSTAAFTATNVQVSATNDTNANMFESRNTQVKPISTIADYSKIDVSTIINTSKIATLPMTATSSLTTISLPTVDTNINAIATARTDNIVDITNITTAIPTIVIIPTTTDSEVAATSADERIIIAPVNLQSTVIINSDGSSSNVPIMNPRTTTVIDYLTSPFTTPDFLDSNNNNSEAIAVTETTHFTHTTEIPTTFKISSLVPSMTSAFSKSFHDTRSQTITPATSAFYEQMEVTERSKKQTPFSTTIPTFDATTIASETLTFPSINLQSVKQAGEINTIIRTTMHPPSAEMSDKFIVPETRRTTRIRTRDRVISSVDTDDYHFGRRTSGQTSVYRGVVNRTPVRIERPAGRPPIRQYPRRRITVYRGRPRRPYNISSSRLIEEKRRRKNAQKRVRVNSEAVNNSVKLDKDIVHIQNITERQITFEQRENKEEMMDVVPKKVRERMEKENITLSPPKDTTVFLQELVSNGNVGSTNDGLSVNPQSDFLPDEGLAKEDKTKIIMTLKDVKAKSITDFINFTEPTVNSTDENLEDNFSNNLRASKSLFDEKKTGSKIKVISESVKFRSNFTTEKTNIDDSLQDFSNNNYADRHLKLNEESTQKRMRFDTQDGVTTTEDPEEFDVRLYSTQISPGIGENTDQPSNEINPSRNGGLVNRKFGRGTSNRQRKPLQSTTIVSPTYTVPSTLITYERGRPVETTLSPRIDLVGAFEGIESYTKPVIVEDNQKTEVSDQSIHAQEYAVTLADPPSSSDTGRSLLRDAIRRKISTTVSPRTDSTTSETSPRYNANLRNRQRSKVKDRPTVNATVRPRRPPIIDYDYYEDEVPIVVGKSAFNSKLFLTSKGTIRCLDQGNFPHPYSCTKFITCARMVNGQVIGTEYTCPDKLSFDPVGGICNWSAGLGCKE